MKISGSCHCGAIEFEAEVDPADVALCHCTDCQNLSGSAFRIVAFAPEHSFRLLKGKPTVYIKTTADSGNKREQTFCPICGSPLYSRATNAKLATQAPKAGAPVPVMGIRVGILKQRGELKPRSQYYCHSALPWAMELTNTMKIPSDMGSATKK